MGWAWLILLLATYPWLLAADLASDLFAGSGLALFVSGACVIAPCRRLRPAQAIPFAGCVGFLFEARRPIPDGTLAISLAAIAIFLTSNKPLLRNAPGMLRAAIIANLLTCAGWFVASSLEVGRTGAAESGFMTQLVLQVGLAAVAGAILFIPVALAQNHVMDRIGIPPATDTQ
jgi:hypothetical protein